MKRFDYAAEVAKQLITISSAFIAVVVAFYEKFFTRSPTTFFLVLLVLVIFIISIIAGVWSLGGLVSLISRQEKLDQKKTKSKLSAATPFVSLRDSSSQRLAQTQQWFFFGALILFIFVALFDNFLKAPTTSIGI